MLNRNNEYSFLKLYALHEIVNIQYLMDSDTWGDVKTSNNCYQGCFCVLEVLEVMGVLFSVGLFQIIKESTKQEP